jgi:hypothetical protein
MSETALELPKFSAIALANKARSPLPTKCNRRMKTGQSRWNYSNSEQSPLPTKRDRRMKTGRSGSHELFNHKSGLPCPSGNLLTHIPPFSLAHSELTAIFNTASSTVGRRSQKTGEFDGDRR